MVGSVAQLRAKPGGGAAWLQGLRDVPYQQASEALCTLPGIGPKVRNEPHSITARATIFTTDAKRLKTFSDRIAHRSVRFERNTREQVALE